MTCVAACVACLLPPSGRAAEWTFDAQASASAEAADNPRLLAEPVDSAEGVVTRVAAVLGHGTPLDRLQLTPSLTLRQFSGDYAQSGTDLAFEVDYQRLGERGRLDLSASYLEDDTATSGFDTTGYTETSVPRQSATAGLEYTFDAGPRTRLLTRVTLDRVHYDDGQRQDFYDYGYVALAGSVQRDIDARSSLRLLARVAQLESPENSTRSTEASIGLGYERDLTERWHASIDAGPTRISTDGAPGAVQVSYRGRLLGRFERTQLSFDARRLASPMAGRGLLETRDDLTAAVSRRLSERWSVDCGVDMTLYGYARQGDAADARSYSRIYGNLVWQAAPRWNWRLTVAEERQDADTTGSGTRLMLAVDWSGRVKAASL